MLLGLKKAMKLEEGEANPAICESDCIEDPSVAGPFAVDDWWGQDTYYTTYALGGDDTFIEKFLSTKPIDLSLGVKGVDKALKDQDQLLQIHGRETRKTLKENYLASASGQPISRAFYFYSA